MGQRQRLRPVTAARTSAILEPGPQAPVPTGQCGGDLLAFARTVGCDTGEELRVQEFKKLGCFIMSSRQVCPLLWKKIPCLSSKAISKSGLCSGGRPCLSLPKLFAVYRLWKESQEPRAVSAQGQDITGTGTPEPLQKPRVLCAGRAGADALYHQWPSSKALQLKLTHQHFWAPVSPAPSKPLAWCSKKVGLRHH